MGREVAVQSPYVIRPLAKQEFLNSVAWYEERRSGLGKRFAAAVERRLEVIAEDPERWPIEEQDVRAAKVPRWKFVIDYRVVSDIIVVIARFHTSREPQDWMDRV